LHGTDLPEENHSNDPPEDTQDKSFFYGMLMLGAIVFIFCMLVLYLIIDNFKAHRALFKRVVVLIYDSLNPTQVFSETR